MLSELVVTGLGIIDRAEISLDAGSTAITGETGAGKTLLVAALELLMGGRSDRSMVRDGAPEARVEGRFLVAPEHPAAALLAAHGLLSPVSEVTATDTTAGSGVTEQEKSAAPDHQVEIVIARTVSAGRKPSRARINGQIAPAGILALLGETLVDIVSQHEHQRLASPSWQRHLLDAWAGPAVQSLAGDVSAAVGELRRAERDMQERTVGERERSRMLDVLNYEIGEIDSAHLEPGEATRLAEETARLEHAESIAAALQVAHDLLAGEGGAQEQVASSESSLRAAADKDHALASLAARVEGLAIELSDVAAEISASIPTADPARLDALRERGALLARLRRKYGDDEAGILEYLASARRKTAELESAARAADGIEALVEEHRAVAQRLATSLGEARRAAAPELERRVEEILQDLALPGARVEVRLEPRPLYEGGLESVELMVALNAGSAPRSLAKSASGGELSRLALALHLVTPSTSAETMIFDEVDAGVGGEAAQAVGRRLADLARAGAAQVVVITHLPQIAALADHHLRVVKRARDGLAAAMVEIVEGDVRLDELSRMLAGLPQSDHARRHAEELLELAREAVSR